MEPARGRDRAGVKIDQDYLLNNQTYETKTNKFHFAAHRSGVSAERRIVHENQLSGYFLKHKAERTTKLVSRNL